MKIKLKLESKLSAAIIPIDYPYPLSAVIYKILDRADGDYAAFLHDTGYRQSGSLKAFKFFTFSDLKTPFKIQGDRLQLQTRQAELVVSFHLPHAAETFIKGLFQDQQIEIADKKSRAVFTIVQVEALPVALTSEAIQEVILQPLSPVVCGKKNEKGNYDFLSPEHPEFTEQLIANWKAKYKAIHEPENVDAVFADTGMEVLLYKNPPKSRLITIKADTPAETKIRGFTNFRLKVRGQKEALALLIDCGIGLYNAQGMGCVEITALNNGL